MSAWHEGPLCGFDLETTGVDVESDRIVTACVARIDGSGRTRPAAARWLVNPGIDIPKGASDIHGVTTEMARADGQDAAAAVDEITRMLARALLQDIPVVGYNVSYDLTLLDRECRRYGLPTLADDLARGCHPVVDAMVLDKHVDRYRKGGRKLGDVARHYNVTLDDAHEASADVWAACGVAVRIGRQYSAVGKLDLAELHELQRQAKREQDESFAVYLRKKGDKARTADEQCELWDRADAVKATAGMWPVLPYERQEALS